MLVTNTSQWTRLLEQLPLSRTEQEVVKRFAQDPSGRGFLPVADVLRAHKLLDESIELLTEGVQAHPQFAVARVVLAREYFHRGMVLESWYLLHNSPEPLVDNVLAQKLVFKLAIAFGDERSAHFALQSLRQQQGVDAEITRLNESLELSGIAATRDMWRSELAAKGIKIHEKPTVPAISQKSESAKSNAKEIGVPKSSRFLLEYDLDEPTKHEFQQFHVVPLDEIFTGELKPLEGQGRKTAVELDSTTLAEIYTKQGHYTRALGIYRRLLRLSPHNDLIRMKVSEVARLERDQRRDDLATDPVIFDRMEVVEIIDRQMRFYSGLLDKIQ